MPLELESYIDSLSDFELLMLYRHRYDELSASMKQLVSNKIQNLNLLNKDFFLLQSLQKDKSKGLVRCPRCYSDKIAKEAGNLDNFRGFYQLYLLAPWLLRLTYTCNICNKKFKKYPSLKQILRLPF